MVTGTSWPVGPGDGVGGSISSSGAQTASAGWAGTGGRAGGGAASPAALRRWSSGGSGGGAPALASGWWTGNWPASQGGASADPASRLVTSSSPSRSS